MGFTAYFMLLKLMGTMMALQSIPHKGMSANSWLLSVHVTLDLSNFVKHISLEVLRQKRKNDS